MLPIKLLYANNKLSLTRTSTIYSPQFSSHWYRLMSLINILWLASFFLISFTILLSLTQFTFTLHTTYSPQHRMHLSHPTLHSPPALFTHLTHFHNLYTPYSHSTYSPLTSSSLHSPNNPHSLHKLFTHLTHSLTPHTPSTTLSPSPHFPQTLPTRHTPTISHSSPTPQLTPSTPPTLAPPQINIPANQHLCSASASSHSSQPSTLSKLLKISHYTPNFDYLLQIPRDIML